MDPKDPIAGTTIGASVGLRSTMFTCPNCGADMAKSLVAETRSVEGGIRRHRICRGCGKDLWTYERLGRERIYVRKHSGKREVLDPTKIRRGLALALRKVVLDDAAIDDLAEEIINKIRGWAKKRVRSKEIGHLVLDSLWSKKGKNYKVGYLRFASVFLAFHKHPDFSTQALLNRAREIQKGDKVEKNRKKASHRRGDTA